MLRITDPNHLTPGAPFLSVGFRPFFLGAGLFSIVSVFSWTLAYGFNVTMPYQALPLAGWHGHEMIFGYALAVIAGFLLTSVRNWTGKPTLSNIPLLGVFSCWLAARVLFSINAVVSLLPSICADTVFVFAVFISLAAPLVRARQWHNFGLVLLLPVAGLGNILFGFAWWTGQEYLLYQGMKLGLFAVVLLILIMGRRVIPFFIEKSVFEKSPAKTQGRIQRFQPVWFDLACLWGFVLFGALEIFAVNDIAIIICCIGLLLLHGWRLLLWYHRGIWKHSLLWVLYVGYAWIVVALLLRVILPNLNLGFLWLHALTYGGIGMVTIGMMARVVLGHTGRNVLQPPKEMHFLFALLCIGAIVRVFIPVLHFSAYSVWVGVSQWFWLCAFIGFVWVYLPFLVKADVT
ncbi:MAG: NnrS family protein [Gammaproteobacteria bacterium]|nr:NnrS family protein [Gammaproteobacteria bacterium]MDH5800039.1 NnrS family protein [Gammaproteobacteria bacterium]